ncbi:alpha/beta hydrolase [Flavobacterium rivuli]|uniref:alpha/beta hydrolase n=1 Tax=Flavobacterium rivuli TaxID=498301 RepID=UPI00037FFADF|nr:dienelactone hydrolase family protein [Flavobacterium rivuli]
MQQKFSFDANQVYLCGFSQGGIVSYSIALTHPELVKGIAVMSGRLLPEIKPFAAPDAKLKKLDIFISHGTADNVLTIDWAHAARAYLKEHGLTPDYHEYAGAGHEINKAMFADLLAWLSK